MAGVKRVRVGDLLIQENVLTEVQLEAALQEQKRSGKKLGKAVVDLGYVDEVRLLEILSKHTNIPYIDLLRFQLNADLVKRLPEIQARRYRALILTENPEGYMLGLLDPMDLIAIDELQRILKKPVVPAFVRESALMTSLDQMYRRQDEIASLAGELEGELAESDFDLANLAVTTDASEAPVVRLLQSLFEDAVQARASDIHIEPDETVLRIRQRIDGVLQEQIMNEKRVASALVSRLKIMSGLDISEKRLPQDGRFNIRVNNKSIDVRLSTMPVQYGEAVVMRLLDQSAGMLDMNHLGMPADLQKRFESLIERPHGMVLVTGPTGSGKTTTLYSALNKLNKADRKIITAEDPIEYRLPRINQVQVKPKIGLDFATVLRAALRQDPDIILVGEMRDHETAEIGLRAAMTGHMVLSTLHTNDAVSTAIRLIDMGVDAFLVASSLRAVIAQRLIRRLCENCKQPYQPEGQDKSWLISLQGNDHGHYHKAQGCHQCNNTGYSGRIGIYELLEMNENLLDALRRANASEFTKTAYADKGFKTLTQRALDLALQGTTSLDEVFRISSTLESVDEDN